jgi:hypothetical protein
MIASARYLSALVVGLCAVSSAAQTPRVPVQVQRGGDDGLTVRLSEAIGEAFRSSSRFSIADENAKVPLKIRIPTNVNWTAVGGRTRVNYSITFSRGGSIKSGQSAGFCFEDELQRCAAHVLADAAKFIGS